MFPIFNIIFFFFAILLYCKFLYPTLAYVHNSGLLTYRFSSCYASDDELDKTVSVAINGEESMIEFIDAQVEQVSALSVFVG